MMNDTRRSSVAIHEAAHAIASHRAGLVPWMVTIIAGDDNGLDKKSVIDLFQVRSVVEERLVRRLGTIGGDPLQSVKAALKVVFGC